MRATKAYIASLGTTGLLVASALAVLLVGGAMVAFDGWPGSDRGDRIGEVVVGDTGASRLTGPELTAADAALAAAAVSAGARGAGGRSDSREAGEAPGGGGPGGDGNVSDPVRIPGGEGPGPRRGSRPAPPAESPGAVDPQAVAEEAGGAAEQLGQAVGRVHPQAGQVVSETGRALNELVQELAPPDRR